METGGASGEAEMGGPHNAQQAGASKKLQHTQATVDEVVGIMKVNVEKVLERDQKLTELENRADALQQGATQFEQHAGKLKRKYWWKNLKMIIIIGIICVIILIIIIGEYPVAKLVRFLCFLDVLLIIVIIHVSFSYVCDSLSRTEFVLG
jgi:vesicle-associated membrane protein 2